MQLCNKVTDIDSGVSKAGGPAVAMTKLGPWQFRVREKLLPQNKDTDGKENTLYNLSFV